LSCLAVIGAFIATLSSDQYYIVLTCELGTLLIAWIFIFIFVYKPKVDWSDYKIHVFLFLYFVFSLLMFHFIVCVCVCWCVSFSDVLINVTHCLCSYHWFTLSIDV
jgi:hypothetical protein